MRLFSFYSKKSGSKVRCRSPVDSPVYVRLSSAQKSRAQVAHWFLQCFQPLGKRKLLDRLFFDVFQSPTQNLVFFRKFTWIYQNSMLMSWPETTEHTNVLLMAHGFRSDLSFCSRLRNFFLLSETVISKLYILTST